MLFRSASSVRAREEAILMGAVGRFLDASQNIGNRRSGDAKTGTLNCNHFRKTQSGQNSSPIWEGKSSCQLLRELAPQISLQVLVLPPVIVDTFLTAPLEGGHLDMDCLKTLRPRVTGTAAFCEPPHRKGRGEAAPLARWILCTFTGQKIGRASCRERV